MMDSIKMSSIIVLYLAACILAAKSSFAIQLLGTSSESHDFSPTMARNVRAEARYHFMMANNAQEKMFQAENNDDVDAYEKWLNVMREEDRKLNQAATKYEEIRDYLEAKIWCGELEIKGFNKKYEKGTMASIFDHLTLRAKE